MIAPALMTQRSAIRRVPLREDDQDHMTVKDDIHHLVDELDDDAAREALAYMQTLGLPAFLRDAPVDAEPVSDDERAAVAEAEAAIARGDVVRDGYVVDNDRLCQTTTKRVVRAVPRPDTRNRLPYAQRAVSHVECPGRRTARVRARRAGDGRLACVRLSS